jgi:hypothetical protein
VRDLPRPWRDEHDAAERAAVATEVVADCLLLEKAALWQEMVAAISAIEEGLTADLIRSSDRDEWNRRAIAALNHVRLMPGRLLRAASGELNESE